MRNILILGALAAAVTGPAFAQEAGVTGNVSLVSDYLWRNVSQSNHDMTVQGGIDLSAGNGLYLGTWASGVDFNNASDANLEVDVYAGYRFDLAGIGVDLGAIYYAYPDSEADDLDFYEVYTKFSRSFGGFTLGASANYNPDNEALYTDLTGALNIGDSLQVSANVGKWLDGMGEYTGYGIGATYTILGTQLGARWYSNDLDTPGFDQDGVVISIGRYL